MSDGISQPPFVSFDEYLRLEADSQDRHDYVNGRIINMAGGSAAHSTVVANLIGEARSRLKGKKCQVFDPNLRIGSIGRPQTHYPDASSVCGPLEYDERDRAKQTILNPTVIFEVLSFSTEEYDRVGKFDHYMTLPAFREYVLIRQDRAEVLVYFKEDDSEWRLRILHGLSGVVSLQSVGIDLAMSELYDRVVFPDPSEIPVRPSPDGR